METPLVSIIIPTFNYGHLISDTLNCLLDQSYNNWEAIIIDDGSTDKTNTIVKPFCTKDKRFIYIYQDNHGVSAARNHGMEICNGKYIQFLDADDKLSKDKLFFQIEYMEQNPDVSISYSNTYYFDHNNPDIFFSDFELTSKSEPDKNNFALPYDAIKEITEKNPFVINSPVFKKEIYNKGLAFPVGSGHVEDWEFWAKCIFNKYLPKYCDNKKVYALVRVHKSSASTNTFLMKIGEGRLRQKIGDFINETALLNKEQKDILKKINTRHRLNLYKRLLFNAKLTDINTLKKIYTEVDKMSFIKCFFKALNMKRKSQFQ